MRDKDNVPFRCYIGYDSREDIAFQVRRSLSVQRFASKRL